MRRWLLILLSLRRAEKSIRVVDRARIEAGVRVHCWLIYGCTTVSLSF
jgi:hypothetical protein